MNNKYNIDGIEYEYGEEVEVINRDGFDGLKWKKRILVGYVKGAVNPFLIVFETDYDDFKNGKEFRVTFYKHIRKIQPTQPTWTQIMIENPDGSFTTYHNTPSLSGRKATLILDGAEHTVTFE